jgi:hypothetical protein
MLRLDEAPGFAREWCYSLASQGAPAGSGDQEAEEAAGVSRW